MKKVAILQSNYIPWKGYFDIINMVDTFVIYDEVQYTKNDWRNRNQVKTSQGINWLTIPCSIKSLSQTIDSTQISQSNWNTKHWQTLKTVYGKAPYFKEYYTMVESWYKGCTSQNLSEINLFFILAINDVLGIKTTIVNSRELNITGERTDRLAGICEKLGASVYLSGPSAKNYLNESVFNEMGISVEWMDYSGYKEYAQHFPPFVHGVTILDLLFNTGSEAKTYLKSYSND